MLSLTRKCEYGLIALCDLAGRHEVASARDIADRHGLSLPLLMNVLKVLTQHNLVRSSRGAHGGYALVQPATEITLSDVVQAIEGPVRLVRCVEPPDSEPPCELRSCCRIRHPLSRVHEQLKVFLGTVSIADIASAETPEQAYYQLESEIQAT